ncbi:MAG: DUF2958 domain-containing protein [Mesorhizobium sp.]|uniref:DUF2958 domain-containing protein n=1 Tax=Mesorhizobium sp. TaxID=1871066 RepID=UPI0011FE6351|nr:MAG: DUF2958 domain-containing protein [Mesorhizobium sp.]
MAERQRPFGSQALPFSTPLSVSARLTTRPKEMAKMMPIEALSRMLENGKVSDAAGSVRDHYPVVRIVSPDTGASWILSELSPHNRDLAYGLYDPSIGPTSLGWVSIAELTAARSPRGVLLDLDRRFRPDGRMSWYTEKAKQRTGRIPSVPT